MKFKTAVIIYVSDELQKTAWFKSQKNNRPSAVASKSG